MSDALIASLTAAVEAAPGDHTLRRHLAGLLVSAGRGGRRWSTARPSSPPTPPTTTPAH